MSTTLRSCIVSVFLLAAARGACAQTGAGSARLTGQVSAAIAVTASEAGTPGEQARVSTSNIDAATVAVSISGSGDGEARVNVPLRVRSNVGYTLRASFDAPNDLAVRLSLADARATGKLVHARALEGIRLGEALAAARTERAAFVTVRNSPPLALLTGPPVSKAGTFSSPDNAIEIVLSIEVRPHPAAKSWSTQLTISAAPGPPAGQ